MAATPKLKQYTHPHPDSPPRPHPPSSPSLLTHTSLSLSLSLSLSISRCANKNTNSLTQFLRPKAFCLHILTDSLPPSTFFPTIFFPTSNSKEKKVEELKQTKNAQTNNNNKQRTKQTLLRFVACSSGSNSNNFENEKRGKSHSLVAFTSSWECKRTTAESFGNKVFQT